jgi:hypothetical protein
MHRYRRATSIVLCFLLYAVSIYRARALLNLTEKFFTLNEDEEERLHPNDLSFVLETAIDHLVEAQDVLNELGSFVNTIRNRWTPRDPGDDWGRLRRIWARNDDPEWELLLCCAKVLDNRPQVRADVEALLDRIEQDIRPAWKREGQAATPP